MLTDLQATSDSKFTFLTSSGAPLTGPQDWQSALVCVDVPPEHWLGVRATRQGVDLPVPGGHPNSSTRGHLKFPYP